MRTGRGIFPGFPWGVFRKMGPTFAVETLPCHFVVANFVPFIGIAAYFAV